MASSKLRSRSIFLMLLQPLPASPLNKGEPFSTMPIREPVWSSILAIMCCKKSNEPSDVEGRPASNLPPRQLSFKTAFFTFASLPQSTPKGGLASMKLNFLPYNLSSAKVSPWKSCWSRFWSSPFIKRSALQMAYVFSLSS